MSLPTLRVSNIRFASAVPGYTYAMLTCHGAPFGHRSTPVDLFGLWLMQEKSKKGTNRWLNGGMKNVQNPRNFQCCKCNSAKKSWKGELNVKADSSWVLWFTTANSIIDSSTNLSQKFRLKFMYCISEDITFTSAPRHLEFFASSAFSFHFLTNRPVGSVTFAN